MAAPFLSIVMLEGGLTAIAIAVAFCWPAVASAQFSWVERAFTGLARKKRWAVAVVGGTALLLRAAMLPLIPIPHPFLQDDFSFLLAAETFAQGRLTNPTPAMWTHFETFHVTMKPTYMSMYFPANALVLAAGKVLAGNPWYGLLVVTALMCAAICWMLQAWLPPGWALLGGVIAVMRLGLFSYWIDSYTGGGSIAALGGALVLGAFPRFNKHALSRHALLLAVGMVLLALGRPYEGFLLCLPVAFMMLRNLLRQKTPAFRRQLLRCAVVPLCIVAGGAVWMAYYNYRVFGDPRIPPYTVNRATYAVVPYYVWQHARPQPAYRHDQLKKFYVGLELPVLVSLQTPSGFMVESLVKTTSGLFFFAGIALLPPLFMIRRVALDRRTRFLVVVVAIMSAGLLIEVFLLPHYLAPFAAAFYAIGLQAMRHVRVFKPGGRPVGLAMVRLLLAVCVLLTGARLAAPQTHLALGAWPSIGWYGAPDWGSTRAGVEQQLQQIPGNHLVIVRYQPQHDPRIEWVYNSPDVDRSKVVWAQQTSDSDMQPLLVYYRDRKVWLAQPDNPAALLTPYATAHSQALTTTASAVKPLGFKGDK